MKHGLWIVALLLIVSSGCATSILKVADYFEEGETTLLITKHNDCVYFSATKETFDLSDPTDRARLKSILSKIAGARVDDTLNSKKEKPSDETEIH